VGDGIRKLGSCCRVLWRRGMREARAKISVSDVIPGVDSSSMALCSRMGS
jgi:hypothetical protein